MGTDDIADALKTLNDRNENVAKNVVIFVGDGMSLPTVTAARIYKAQKEGRSNSEGSLLFFETFPHVGLSKTYSVDFTTADSSSTATAIFAGVKTKSETMGFDATVVPYKVDSEKTSKKITTVLEWAQGPVL